MDVERQAGAGRAVLRRRRRRRAGSSEFLPSQIRLMQSLGEIAERVVGKLNLLADPQFNPKRFAEFRPDAKGNVPTSPRTRDVVDAAIGVQKLLGVTILRGTSLVEIAAVAPSPELAAAIPNAVAEAYIDWNVESRCPSDRPVEPVPGEPDRAGEVRDRGQGKGALRLRPRAGHHGGPHTRRSSRSTGTSRRRWRTASRKEARYRGAPRSTAPEAIADSSVVASQRAGASAAGARTTPRSPTSASPCRQRCLQLKAQIEDATRGLAGTAKRESAARSSRHAQR